MIDLPSLPPDTLARDAAPWPTPDEFSATHAPPTSGEAPTIMDIILSSTKAAPLSPPQTDSESVPTLMLDAPSTYIHRVTPDASAPVGMSVVSLPSGTVIRFGSDTDASRVSILSGELRRDRVVASTRSGEFEAILPNGWALVRTSDAFRIEALPQDASYTHAHVAPFARRSGEGVYRFGFYAHGTRMKDHPLAAKSTLTKEGLTTSGGYPIEFSNAVRPVSMPAYMPSMKGRLAATAETMGHIYRDLAFGSGRGVTLPGAGLTDFIARIDSEVEGRTDTPDGTAIRRFGYAFGGRAVMPLAIRNRLYDLADRGERRDPLIPQRQGSPVYMTSAVSPLFPDFTTARGAVSDVAREWQPLAGTWLNYALFVLGETDTDTLRNIADFESGALAVQLDPLLVDRLRVAKESVHHTRKDRERTLAADMTAPSTALADLVDTVGAWQTEWHDSRMWVRRADAVASAAHSASVLDVMALTVMLWRPTPATYALGPIPKTRGADKVPQADRPLPREAVMERLEAEARSEAQQAAVDPTVAGRLMLRSVVLPACLRSLYGADVSLTNHGQVVAFGARAHGLTLRAGKGGRMDACLKGERAQAALWAEVMHAAGLAPKWRV